MHTAVSYARWTSLYRAIEPKKPSLIKPSVPPTNGVQLEWPNMQYMYNEKDDTFMLAFTKYNSKDVKTQKQLSDTVFAILDSEEKILALECKNALKSLSCHLLEYPLSLDEFPPCTLVWSYSSEDAMYISFTDPETNRFHYNIQANDPFPDIFFDCDSFHRLFGVEILLASKLVAKQR
jgi:uncharacterized protein YuzE